MEDLEEDETPLRICEVEYEPGDRLFMTRILSEPAIEDLCTTSTISGGTKGVGLFPGREPAYWTNSPF